VPAIEGQLRPRQASPGRGFPSTAEGSPTAPPHSSGTSPRRHPLLGVGGVSLFRQGDEQFLVAGGLVGKVDVSLDLGADVVQDFGHDIVGLGVDRSRPSPDPCVRSATIGRWGCWRAGETARHDSPVVLFDLVEGLLDLFGGFGGRDG
jgi:hypothetical protein